MHFVRFIMEHDGAITRSFICIVIKIISSTGANQTIVLNKYKSVDTMCKYINIFFSIITISKSERKSLAN